MNENQDHLTVEQIECLMAIQLGKNLSPDQVTLRDRAELHLAQCAACREALAMETDAQRRIHSLAGGGQGMLTEKCPSRERIYEFAGKQLQNK